MSRAVLDVRGLTRRFGSLTAVNDLSFQVNAGEICGFIGPNGAGKTTTLRICATLDLPDEGDVFIGDHSVLDEPREARAALGFMPDAVEMEPNTLVIDWLDFYARAVGLRGARRREMVDQVIVFTGLGSLLFKECAVLSKGNAQRLLLARTMLHDPALLLLDEPAAGLDPRARVELRELVKALAAMGKAVLLSSHILTELAEMCHTVAILEQGRLVASGPVAAVLDRVSVGAAYFLRCLAPAEEVERRLVELPGVRDLRPERGGVVVGVDGGDEAAAALLAELVKTGLKPIEFSPMSVDLEDAFLRLTEGRLQ